MIYILTGQDDYSIARALEKIKKQLGDPAALSAGTTTLDGQQLTAEELKNVIETVPFLTEKRLVIVSGLLARFEPRTRPRRQRKTPREISQANGHQAFGQCITGLPETTVLVLLEDRLSPGNPLLKALSGQATVKAFPPLRDAKLQQWVKKRISEEGGTISEKAANLLGRLVGGNLWVLDSEIKKLVLYATGRSIEEEDIRALVGYAQQVTVFTMVDAILEARAEPAGRMLQQLLQQGAAPSYLLSMLARQARLLVRAREMKSQGKSDTDVQNSLGLNNEYALRKTLEQAGRYSPDRIREVYHHLLETDLSIKTGRSDAELALTILVAELCRQRSARPARSGV